MRHGLLSYLLIALAVLTAVCMADTESEVTIDVDGDLQVEEEEMLDAGKSSHDAGDIPMQEVDPRLTPDVVEKIFAKLSAKCLKQVQDNPMDPSQVSDRCRMEVSKRIQRYLERLDNPEKFETKEKKQKTETKEKKQKAKPSKSRSRKSKKQTRAQRKAAAAQAKEEEYQKTLQVIVGFVATLVAIIAGVMFFINRKLKAAGLYFPDPDAKATCCN